MADLNLDELNEEFERASRNLQGFNTGLLNSSNSSGILATANKNSAAAIAKEAKAREEYAKELKNSAKELGSSIKGMASGLAQGQTGFQTMGNVINATTKAVGGLLSGFPVIGGLLKGAVEGLAEASKIMVDQLQVSWSAFKQISDTGLVSTFEDLQELGDATATHYQEINSVLGKYSTSLALFGGSALEGTKHFAKLSRESDELRKHFNQMGINAQEFAEYQAKYIEDQTRTGRIKGKTDAELLAGTREYINELDLIAKMTGTSRKGIQDQRKQAEADSKWAATLQQNKGRAERLRAANDILTQFAPEIAKGMRATLSGYINTKDAQELLVQTGGVSVTAAQKLKSGEINEYEFMNMIGKAMAKSLDERGGTSLAAIGGDTTVLGKNFAERLRIAQADFTPEKIAAAKAAQTSTTEKTKTLAGAETDIQRTSINLQKLATSGDMAAKAVAGLASTTEAMTSRLNKALGIKSSGPSESQRAYMAASSASSSGGLTRGIVPLANNSSIVDKIIQAESGGKNIGAIGGRSSAWGLAQFTKGTFEGLVRKSKPGDPLYGKTWEQYKSDTGLQRTAALALTNQNMAALASQGHAATAGNTYLAHFLGSGGANKVLSAAPSTPVSAVVSAQAMSANPEIFKKVRTAGDLAAWAANKMGDTQNQTQMASAPTAPAQVATVTNSRKESTDSIAVAVMNKLDDISTLLQRSLAAQQKIANQTA